MNLAELKKVVAHAIEVAADCGQDPVNIKVTLEIDGTEGHFWAGKDVTLFYDNDGQTSGCVIVAQKDS